MADVVGVAAQGAHEGHPNRSSPFDLEQDDGGTVDVEFVIQYLVLACTRDHARLFDNLGNIAPQHIAGELGLIDARLATPSATPVASTSGCIAG